MAINIKFDLSNNPETPTLILATRNGKKLGQLNARKIELSDKFNDASEISFVLYKTENEFCMDDMGVESVRLTSSEDDFFKDLKEMYLAADYEYYFKYSLWDKVVDFKLVYCKEWDMWFEIGVKLDEETETIKTVFCKQLGQSELSQIMLYDIEINTEDDIARDDYKISILYDENDDNCILNRLLRDKAPHYHIAYVSPTIAKLQRSFSFNDTSIYDAFQEIAKEIGCLFVFHSGTDPDGKIQRAISVYDLQQNCLNVDCGYRGEFTDKCPECGSTDIRYGYGEDTTIFVTSDELAASGIQLTTDVDSVKNCFKLEAGDDLMTSTVRNCNPNGTDYIWHFSDAVKEDMSHRLVSKMENYNAEYQYYYNEHESDLDSNLVSKYNTLVDKYSKYKEELKPIDATIKGYSSLMNAYYDAVDLSLYLQSGMMPSVEMSDTNAEEQMKLLTTTSLSPVAVADVDIVSLTTANSAVLAMAKVVVRSTFKVEVKENSSSLYDNDNKKYWKGKFIVANYSNEEDVAESGEIIVELNDDLETVTKQKIDKLLNKKDGDDVSVSGLFEKEYDDFCAELKKYALNPLNSFHNACQSCIDVLIEQGAGNESDESKKDLYDNLYTPYYNKLKAIESEIKIREDEINIVNGVYDEETDELITAGIRTNIEKAKNQIQDALDFEKYLGTDLWLEFCAYRREDKYFNDNYISDGLNNADLFKRALEFIKVAEDEIYKSAELQHSISTSLKNLLAIPKFKSLVKHFNVGNWIRVQVDKKVYKLRLLDYDIDFDDFDNIPVTFSDVLKVRDGISDMQNALEQAKSMATSYDSVQKQASQGDKAKTTIEEWIEDGLQTSVVQINNNNNEGAPIIDNNGITCYAKDSITGEVLPKKLRITHNVMVYTDDDFKTARMAIGEHKYKLYDKESKAFVDRIGYGMNADFVQAGIVTGSQIIGGDIYSDNYSIANGTGSYLNLRDGTFSFGGGALRFEGGKLMISSPDIPTTDTITEINEEYLKTTSVYAQNLQVNSAHINGKLTANQIDVSDVITVGSSQITTITEDAIKTTNVIAENLTVKAANVDGVLTASQIESGTIVAGSVAAENISGTTITGKTISGGTVSGSTITGGSINIGNGAFTVSNAGVLYCSSANIEGVLKAGMGSSIAEFTVDENSIFSGKWIAGTAGNPGTMPDVFMCSGSENPYKVGGVGVSNLVFGAGGNFGVTKTGDLYATRAHISGDSSIGGFKVDGNSIFFGEWKLNENVMADVFMCTGAGTALKVGDEKIYNLAFGAGGNFGVTKTGDLYATSGKIGGWEIAKNFLGSEAKPAYGEYAVALYPKGTLITGYSDRFFLVIRNHEGAPIGGLCATGWKSL